MPNTYLTSDEHYGHRRIPELAERPFGDIEGMNAALVDGHNAVVKDSDDLTFHLGDFFFGARGEGQMAEVLRSLTGRHVLVAGNHDRCSVTATNGWEHQRQYIEAGFEAVVDAATLTLPAIKVRDHQCGNVVEKIPARKVMLSHFPYAEDHTDQPRYMQHRLRDEGRWLVHGHVHQAYTVRDRGVNVGVDRWGYRPVNIHDVARLIADVEAGRRTED